MKKFGNKFTFAPTQTEINCLVDFLKNWQPFPDTVAALTALKQKYKLPVISHTALCLTIRYNSRGGKKEKNETLLPRYASKDR